MKAGRSIVNWSVPDLQLRYLTGPRRDQTVIATGPCVRIGRSRDNDLVLPELPSPRSSSHHAEARLEGSVWWIVDLGSTNHTLLNGAPVDRAPLRSGDRLALGDAVFEVRIGRRRAAGWMVAGAAALAAAAIAAAIGLLRRPAGSPFEEVAAAAPRSVYLLAIEAAGRRTAIGTAFAVEETRALLATNAHVVHILQRQGALSAAAGPAIAVRSDSDQAVPVLRAWAHPDWHEGSVAHDVALVQLAGRPPVAALSLGDARAVERIHRGATLATFGFPAVSTDPLHPRGRLAVDVVGDVRLPFIEVGLSIAPGTSGSPVFDDSGAVVGIVVGGDFVDAGDGRGRRPTGSAANWVIAVTALRELLEARREALVGPLLPELPDPLHDVARDQTRVFLEPLPAELRVEAERPRSRH